MDGVAELQPLLRAGDADEGEAAFLFQLLVVVDAPLVRQQPLFHGDHKHDRKLEALGGVERHHRHFVALGLPAVGLVDEPGVFQILLQMTAAGMGLVELAGVGEKFFDIRQAVEVFL